jgi:hypothetical protein
MFSADVSPVPPRGAGQSGQATGRKSGLVSLMTLTVVTINKDLSVLFSLSQELCRLNFFRPLRAGSGSMASNHRPPVLP